MLPLEKPKQFPTVKEMAEWAYQHLREKDYGATIDYGELSSVLTIDGQSHRGRAAILRAGRRLLKSHQKLIVNVRNVGYQIAQPNEHVGESQRLQKAARRRLNRALATVIHVSLEALPPGDRAKVLTEQMRTMLKLSLGRKLDRQKALPEKKLLALPSGANLVKLLTKTSA